MFPKEGLRKAGVTDAPSAWEGLGRHRDGGMGPFGFTKAEMKNDFPGGDPDTEGGGKVRPLPLQSLCVPVRGSGAEGKGAKRQVRARSRSLAKQAKDIDISSLLISPANNTCHPVQKHRPTWNVLFSTRTMAE